MSKCASVMLLYLCFCTWIEKGADRPWMKFSVRNGKMLAFGHILKFQKRAMDGLDSRMLCDAGSDATQRTEFAVEGACARSARS
jgi:hypothetical protein